MVAGRSAKEEFKHEAKTIYTSFTFHWIVPPHKIKAKLKGLLEYSKSTKRLSQGGGRLLKKAGPFFRRPEGWIVWPMARYHCWIHYHSNGFPSKIHWLLTMVPSFMSIRRKKYVTIKKHSLILMAYMLRKNTRTSWLNCSRQRKIMPCHIFDNVLHHRQIVCKTIHYPIDINSKGRVPEKMFSFRHCPSYITY